MFQKIKKLNKFTAIIITLAIIISTIAITNVWVDNSKSQASSQEITNLDRQVTEKDINDLKQEGYTIEEITEVRILADRILNSLQEICGSKKSESEIDIPSAEGKGDSENESTKYTEIVNKFNVKDAVIYAVKLKNQLGSFGNVLDEYLYCLQIGLDLGNCLNDKQAYENEKKEKSISINASEIITVSKIELKMLEVIHSRNVKNANAANQRMTNNTSSQNIYEDVPVQQPVKQEMKPQVPNIGLDPVFEGYQDNNRINPKARSIPGNMR